VHCIVSPHIISGRSVASIIASITAIQLCQFVIQKVVYDGVFFKFVMFNHNNKSSVIHEVLIWNGMNFIIFAFL